MGKGHARACARTLCRELCKMAEPIEREMPFGLWTQVWPKEACMGVEISHTKGQFLVKMTCQGMPDDNLP